MTRLSLLLTGSMAGLILALGCQEPRMGQAVSPLGPSPLVVEPAEIIVTAGHGADFKAKTQDGARPVVVWEAQGGGAVDATGHFTAPGTPGLCNVKATSLGRVALARVQVVPAPMGPVTGPDHVLAAARGLHASVPALEGATYQWTVDGGTILGGARESAVAFNAGPGPKIVLSCRIVNAAGTGLTTSLEIPLVPRPTLTVTPGLAVVTAGGRFKVGYSLVGGLTGEVDWTILEPEGGAVDTIGVYRAPAVPGVYTVQARAREDEDAKGSISIKVVAAPTGPVRAPAKIAPGAKALKAAVPEQPGCTYSWKVTGGKVVGDAHGASVLFDAGSGPSIQLECEITNEAKDAFIAKAVLPVS